MDSKQSTQSPIPSQDALPPTPQRVPGMRSFLWSFLVLVILITIILSGYTILQKHYHNQIFPLLSSIPSPTTQPTPTPYPSDEDYLKAASQAAIFFNQHFSTSTAAYTQIPTTDFEIKIPNGYMVKENTQDNMFDGTTLLTYQLDLPENIAPLLAHPGGWWEDIRIGKVMTALPPEEWVLDNILQQGIKLRDEPPSVSRGTKVTIAGREYLTLNAGCCAVSYIVYFLPYAYKDEKSILIFATHSTLGTEGKNEERNKILDTILSTLRQKQ